MLFKKIYELKCQDREKKKLLKEAVDAICEKKISAVVCVIGGRDKAFVLGSKGELKKAQEALEAFPKVTMAAEPVNQITERMVYDFMEEKGRKGLEKDFY